uniref:Mex-3 RNA binding family member B n=1 Tax=Paramormyrops kingsleyae TaxID=1676925 RepID=A0A3B3Q7P6_9TELE|nr:RNA-binding protein MEX3B-like [Paramormyrops kingsleyae]
MPSSLFADMERNGSNQGDTLDDQRALQIALDQLSLLDLDNDDSSMYDNEPRKKSVNMTECVPVPSSEHVAEIVGRQGCKIKALRAKTNTYIKTPVRGEEPVFVVTGRREDVAMARREIISAAEHFSMIRASRNKNGGVNGTGTLPGPPSLPGQTTIQVRVPYRVVGLVVGPKGATIKRIQQQTHTYIVTPSRDKEPVFEVTGMPENVDRAREEIEAHIAVRTGGLVELADDNDFHANGTDVGFELQGHAGLWGRPSATRKPFSSYRNDSSSSLGSASTDSYFGTGSGSRLADYSPPSPELSYTATTNGNNNNNPSINSQAVNGNGFAYAGDVVSPDSAAESPPGFDPTPTPPGLVWSQYDRTNGPSSSPTAAIFPSAGDGGVLANPRRASGAAPPTQPQLTPPLHPLARRVRSDPGGGALSLPGYGPASGSLPSVPSDSSASSTSSCSSGTSRKGSRDCSVCFESEVIAALVPCGHNLFCMECANRICERSEPVCPVCHTAVSQAIRIFS